MPRQSLKQRILEEAARREHEAKSQLAHAVYVRRLLQQHGSGPLPDYLKRVGVRWGIK